MENTRHGRRSVATVIQSASEMVAPGFFVRRPIPGRERQSVDPFLLLDHVGPRIMKPLEGTGVPDHPHRGFEAVSFIFDGYLEHRDSRGNHGVMRPGDVQWMTAGSGIIHSEMFEREFREHGGPLHAIQLWVNLPRRHKMATPGYQNIAAASIPSVEIDGARVRVIAGDLFGLRGPAWTHTPVIAAHVTAGPEAAITATIGEGMNVAAYVMTGHAAVNGAEVPAGSLAVLGRDGDGVELRAGDDGCELLLIAGEPLNEPVITYGPFVMNTKVEIGQAIDDYRNGLMGAIAE